MAELKVFNTVDTPQLIPYDPYSSGQKFGSQAFQDMSIGNGDKAFHADASGIWLGANNFADAPFAVDMDGNLYAASATFGQYIPKASNSTLSGVISVGNGNVKIDGVNKRIIINDGTNDRVLLGYQASGF